MDNSLHGCSGRLKGGYPRKQLAFVGAHKLIHEIFKTPLFAFVSDGKTARDTPPRVAPYTFKNLGLWEGVMTANAGSMEESNDVDDLRIVPAENQILSPSSASLADVSRNTSSDEDLSDIESVFSSRAEDLSSDSSSGVDRDTNTAASDVEDLCFSHYLNIDQDGLIITTMETIDLHEPQTRVILPRSDNNSTLSLASPIASSAMDQYIPNHDVQTMPSLQLFEPTTNVVVLLPGMRLPLEHECIAAVDRDLHMLPERNIQGPSSFVLQNIVNLDILGALQQSLNSFQRASCSQGLQGYGPGYSHMPLQSLDPNNPPSAYARLVSQQDPSSCWSTGYDYAYNELHVPVVTSNMDASTAYYALPADATIYPSQQTETRQSSQVATLLSILNASSIPYDPSSPHSPHGAFSCLEDPPIVRLAPIGHPTARPMPSPYIWPRSGSSCGSSPNPSPLSSPLSPHREDGQALSWPPVLSGLRS